MSADPESRAILAKPGTLLLPSNSLYRHDLSQAGGRVVRRPSGHRVFFGREGRRLLYVDPDGQALHECEWASSADGSTRLVRARVWLDWDQWVGIVPGGLVNSTSIDLSTRPGWQRLKPDDLRQMAARAIGVPLSEMQFFYPDEDLRIDPRGQATIVHRKDALYLLPGGGFDGARFMACMGAMHWADIDFLPVVELFQSLLPGTGSAVLELIRELYDDQCPSGNRPLRYRGIPTYPSEAAFGLFSGFFSPRSLSGADPVPLFMDPPRSHEVIWLPAPSPLRRVSDHAAGLCLTLRGTEVTKATLRDDPAGLSYGPPDKAGAAVYGRSVTIEGGAVCLREGETERRVPLNPSWGSLTARAVPPSPSRIGAAPDWRDLFAGGAPAVEPAAAFGAVLLYPDDEQEIGPLASQPFVADYLHDLFEQEPAHWPMVGRARTMLIHNFDAVLTTLIPTDRPRAIRVVYRSGAFAQRQAQRLWAQAAREGRWDWWGTIKLQTAPADGDAIYQQAYDVIYDWLVDVGGQDADRWAASADRICRSLGPGGLGCVVGPAASRPLWTRPGNRLLEALPVASLPTFRMHRTILPRARLREGLTLFLVAKH